MCILVTGGAGFIGTNFVLNNLNENSEQMIVYDKLTSTGKKENFKLISHKKNFQFIKGDITNLKKLKDIFLKFKPLKVIHFAAETHVDNSIKNPKKFVETNIIGTFCLLEIIKNYYESLSLKNKKAFVFINVSTDEVYGSLDQKAKAVNEKYPFLPNSPYSATKASADHLVRSYYKTFNIPIITTHCSNNFGPFQDDEKFIPKIIKNVFNWNKIPIYGDGKNIRDWLFVDDHCNAINLIMNEGTYGENYNIGGDNEISNINLVYIICKKLNFLFPNPNGPYENLISFVKDRSGHDFRYAIDSSKLKNKLGWKVKNSFDKNLDYTLKWYLEKLQGNN